MNRNQKARKHPKPFHLEQMPGEDPTDPIYPVKPKKKKRKPSRLEQMPVISTNPPWRK